MHLTERRRPFRSDCKSRERDRSLSCLHQTWFERRKIGGAFCQWLVLQVGDQPLHLCNLAYLGCDDAIGQYADAGIADMGLRTGEDGDGVMWDHGAHVVGVPDCLLTAHKPERS